MKVKLRTIKQFDQTKPRRGDSVQCYKCKEFYNFIVKEDRNTKDNYKREMVIHNCQKCNFVYDLFDIDEEGDLEHMQARITRLEEIIAKLIMKNKIKKDDLDGLGSKWY